MNEFIEPRTAAVWAAVAQGARSWREVAQAIGCAESTAHEALHEARDVGLVAFDDRRQRTLHSTVRRVA